MMRSRWLRSAARLACAVVLALPVSRAVTQQNGDTDSREAAASVETRKPPVTTLRYVKRLCVEDFDGGENARQLRALLIAEIHRSGVVVVTENPLNADACLRGFAEDTILKEHHSRDENSSARGTMGVTSGGYTRNRRSVNQSVGASTVTRDRSEVQRHEASLAIRIVNSDGDVLWSGTAESRGGKFRSASADVASKLARELTAQWTSPADAR